MTDRKDGGPAFPIFDEFHGEVIPGMSLHDYFATAALTGLMASPHRTMCGDKLASNPDEWAQVAYDLADAMLAKAREGSNGDG